MLIVNKSVSLAEAARLTGISYNTLYHYIQAGVIFGVKRGNTRWLIPQAEVDRLLRGDYDASRAWTRKKKKEIEDAKRTTRVRD